MTDTSIYIIAAGVLGVVLGMIVEMISEKPYIESLERKLETKNKFEVIHIKPEEPTGFNPEDLPEDLFSPF